MSRTRQQLLADIASSQAELAALDAEGTAYGGDRANGAVVDFDIVAPTGRTIHYRGVRAAGKWTLQRSSVSPPEQPIGWQRLVDILADADVPPASLIFS